ncbi:MAG: PAS domain S-box protein [Betaproteobacteria bacterium]|nr:PAS domain S-box protein [Betaproteobacteria bacterium]
MTNIADITHLAERVLADEKEPTRPMSHRLIWLAGAILVFTWAVTAFLVIEFYNRDRARAESNLSDTLVIAATQMEAELGSINSTLDATAEWLSAERMLATSASREGEIARIRERLATLQVALPSGTALGVADASGKLVTSIPAAKTALDLSKAGFFRELADRNNSRAVLGAPRIGKLGGGMRMPFAVRVMHADGSFGGVLFASIAHSHLAGAIDQLSTLSHTCIALLSAAGERIVQAGAAGCAVPPVAPGEVLGAQRFARVTRGEHGFLATTKSLPIGRDFHIDVAVFVDEEEAMAYFRDARRQTVGIAIAISLMIMAFALVLAREFVRREKIEIALKQRESSLDSQRMDLVEAQSIAKLGSWTYDLAADRISPTAEYLKILGIRLEDCPHSATQWVEKFVDGPHREEALENLTRLRQALPYEGTRKITRPNGEERWVQYKSVPFFDAAGRHLGHRGVVRDITEEKIAQETLAQRTLELETAKRIGGLGAWSWDTQTDALTVDDHTLQIYEVTREDAPQTLMTWGLLFIHPQEVEGYRDLYSMRFHGQAIDVVRRILSGKRNAKWIHTLGNPRFDAAGKLAGYHGVSRDITQQKSAETRLAESEQKYRLITESMRDIVAIYDVDSSLVFATPSLTSTLGYTVEESIGRRAAASIHRDDYAHVRAALKAMIAGNSEAANVWFRYPHAAGHWVWLESVVVPLRNDKGRIEHFQATTREITLRKQAELALRASEERFRSLTELSSDWYWEQDAQYRFTFMSRDHFRWTQKTREQLLGRTRWEHYPDALTAEEWVAHRADLDARRPFYNLISKVVDPDTGNITGYSSLSGQPVFGEHGEFVGYRGTGQDITARKFAEEALARRTRELALSNKWLEEEARERQLLERNFLMAIEMELAQVGLELHDDLGQDLTGIALLTKTLEKRLAEAGIGASADAARISELTNRAIQHTRMISHGLSPYIWGSEGLVAALAQLANDIDSLGDVRCEATLDKEIEISEEVVARNLYRIAQESVNNALKHGHAKRIGITLSQRGHNISLTVVDDGIGHAARSPDDNAEVKFHSIRHRANSINAKLSIRRGRRGGTVVRVVCAQRTDATRSVPSLEKAE